jgi:hypothetical protein
MPLADGARYSISAIGLANVPQDPLVNALIGMISTQGRQG